MNLSQIFQRRDFRIDLFEKEVCGRFSLSDKMMERAELVIELNNLTVFLCSSEDIFLCQNARDHHQSIDWWLARSRKETSISFLS